MIYTRIRFSAVFRQVKQRRQISHAFIFLVVVVALKIDIQLIFMYSPIIITTYVQAHKENVFRNSRFTRSKQHQMFNDITARRLFRLIIIIIIIIDIQAHGCHGLLSVNRINTLIYVHR